MRPDLVLEARAFVRGQFQHVEIGLDEEHGTILAVKKTLAGEPRRRFAGQLMVPSGIDLHVHFRDPGHPKKEDFRSGTRGAALGGIGTVFDMPNTDPIVDRPSRLEEKRERVAPKACVDWGLWATLTPQTKNPLTLLNAACGLKLYLSPTTGISDPGTDSEIALRLELARRAQRLTVLHAERPHAGAPATLWDHHTHRPVQGEIEAVQAVARIPTAGAVHVAHASTVQTVEAALEAHYSVAVTPHHLLLSSNTPALGTRGKVNPPLRPEAARSALWRAFLEERVPLIESDHAPHTPEEKALEFAEAPAGVPGVETTYPLLLHHVRAAGGDVALVIRALSERPAMLLGLNKGRIEAGFAADFFLIDPQRPHRIRGADLQSRCGWTPFEGWPALQVEEHWIRGHVVVEDHRFVGRAGSGRPVAVGDARPLRFEPPSNAQVQGGGEEPKK